VVSLLNVKSHGNEYTVTQRKIDLQSLYYASNILFESSFVLITNPITNHS